MIQVLLQPAVLEIIEPLGHAECRAVIIQVWLDIPDTVLSEIFRRQDLRHQSEPETLFNADPVGKLYLDGLGMPEVVGQEERDRTAGVEAVFTVSE